jgi:dTMP kinase
MKKGFFIVIEGVDGSGKAMQTKLLKEKFERSGYEILIGDFPRYYTSEWGKLVGRFLTGEFGKLDEVNPHLAVLPYMIDQYVWSRDFAIPWIKGGGIILSNRYFTSNVHQIAKLKGVARKKYRDWLWPMGYEELGILRPDLVLFLDVPPQISLKLNKTKPAREYLKGKKQDIAERRRDHQFAAYKSYLSEVRLNDWWIKVKCVSKGKLDSPEVIHQRVWKVVEYLLT